MKPGWCAEHQTSEPCFVCNNRFAPAAVDLAVVVDPVFVERVRRAMLGDLLWLADLLDGLGGDACVCDEAICPT